MDNTIEPIGIVGLGRMGSSMARILIKNYEVHAFEISKQSIQDLRPILKTKVILHDQLESLLNTSFPLIIAVKPHQVKEVISQIKVHRLIISIAAGISIPKMEEWQKKKAPLVRAMPNAPFQVGKGVTCIFLIRIHLMRNWKKQKLF